ncbi:hypothetical protein ANN_19670 [Periplaneta americana]|uniref:Uncharacterized protein n=1 Tax=Periplaneta americana TaxID=6978 RepID=A0ABQ8SBN2_PERAM|nr:hypothetical protein ANN_19670 [Periplaneta americana]
MENTSNAEAQSQTRRYSETIVITRRITYVPEKLPSKYDVHSEEYLPIRTPRHRYRKTGPFSSQIGDMSTCSATSVVPNSEHCVVIKPCPLARSPAESRNRAARHNGRNGVDILYILGNIILITIFTSSSETSDELNFTTVVRRVFVIIGCVRQHSTIQIKCSVSMLTVEINVNKYSTTILNLRIRQVTIDMCIYVQSFGPILYGNFLILLTVPDDCEKDGTYTPYILYMNERLNELIN